MCTLIYEIESEFLVQYDQPISYFDSHCVKTISVEFYSIYIKSFYLSRIIGMVLIRILRRIDIFQ